MLVTVWSKVEKVSRAIFLPCTIKRLLASPFQNISKLQVFGEERDNVSKLAITKHEKVNIVSVLFETDQVIEMSLFEDLQWLFFEEFLIVLLFSV